MNSQVAHRTHSRERPSSRVQLRLRVFSGVHAGAEFRLPERGILMVGQADDCDLILGDAEIRDHHCVLTVVGDQVLLRALNGEVEIQERRVADGENVALEPFTMVRLGKVWFAIGPHWSERWLSLDNAIDHAAVRVAEKQLAGRRRGVLAIATALLAFALVVLLGSWKVSHPANIHPRSASEQLEATQGILHQMSLQHVVANIDGGDRLVVHGVVGNVAQLPELKRKLSAAGLTTELAVRDWPSVAKQVKDIFGMHGYTVETRLLDQGLIEVDGHFGDPDNTERVKREVLGSADMQNLNSDVGLNLALRNYDERKPEAPKLDEGKLIQHVSSGADSYVVTRDQSRYYPGSSLPQGGIFVGVTSDQNILLRMRDNTYMQLNKDDKYMTPQPLGDMNSIDMERLMPAAPGSSAAAAAPAAVTQSVAKAVPAKEAPASNHR
ncbi:FHA domain-containing protein [Dyella choica]|nr:FHA domain-containing protein [Dyella choica]